MVPKVGLEPTRLTPPPPQDGVSTNSTTSAFSYYNYLLRHLTPWREGYFIIFCQLLCYQQALELNSQVHLFVEEQLVVRPFGIEPIPYKTTRDW